MMVEFRDEEYGLDRRILYDFLSLASGFRIVRAGYDIDFSSVYAFRAGQPAERRPSILCCVAYAIGQVLPRHPRVNSHLVRWPRKRLAIFDAVDLAIPVDYVVAGRHILRQKIIRGVDRLTLDEVNEVLESWHGERESGVVPAHSRAVRWLFGLPRFVRWLIWHIWIETSPKRRAALLGTCALTCVSSAVYDFVFSDGPRALSFSLGRIRHRPVIRNGTVTSAPIGQLVRSYDHRVVDGYEAEEFMKDLVGFLGNFADQVRDRAPTRAAAS